MGLLSGRVVGTFVLFQVYDYEGAGVGMAMYNTDEVPKKAGGLFPRCDIFLS